MSPRFAHGLAMLSLLLLAFGGTVVEAKTDPMVQQLEFGVEMAKRGLWNEALFRFKQAEQLNPGSARVLNNMAVAYEALGQFDRALEYYQRAVQAGGNSEARQNYSRFVEFYRNFKPDGDDDSDSGDSDDGDSDDGDSDDEESASTPSDSSSAESAANVPVNRPSL